MKLSDAKVRSIKPPTKGRAQYSDTSVPGLILRVTTNGIKTWAFSYREDGKQRKMVLGRFPAVGLSEARSLARQAYRERLGGHDPQDQRDQRKRTASNNRRDTFGKTAEEFQRIYMPRNSAAYQKEVGRILRKDVLPLWGERPITGITKRDCIDLIEGITEKKGPHAANHVRSMIRKLLSWAAQRDIIDVNPAVNVERPISQREVQRDRVLSDKELRAVWRGAKATPYPFGPFVQLLILTAQRRREVSDIRYENVEGSLWTIPAESTKSSRSNQVHLAKPCMGIIKAAPRFDGPFVFSTRAGEVPISGFSKAKKLIDEASGVKDWRFHDLRRTAATRMNEIGVEPHVVESILNHSIPGVAGVYNLAKYLPQKKKALERWSKYVVGLTKK